MSKKDDVGINIKDMFGMNILGPLDKLVDAATKLGEASGNLSEEQIERLEEAKKVLGERGENVFNLGKLAGSFSINSGSRTRPMGGGSKRGGGNSASFKPKFTKGGSNKGPSVEEVKEPIIDIFTEEDQTIVIIEMPGVEESDIELELKGDVLNLNAKKYQKEILLSDGVGDNMEWTYKNGILEVKVI